MKPGIAVRTLAALPAQAMQKALEELPRDTVLLNFGYYRTADGQSYSMKESLQQLRSWTDLPMYSPWSGQLGKGVLARPMRIQRIPRRTCRAHGPVRSRRHATGCHPAAA